MAKPIHAYSYKYILLRKFVEFYFHIFFRKVSIVGKENIPKGEPVLFAVNHQCTLMDAFAVIFTLKSYQVFMARADIFKNPLAAKFLRFIKIIPIFRMRDGIKNLQNNDSSFNDAVGTLEAKERLVILPEGSHFGEKRLRSLKKGLARIAFQAEEKNDFKLGIKVIPVGIDYSDYIKFGSRILVQYGEAYTMEEYFSEYKENPQKAMNRFMNDLRDKMIPMMLNIDDSDNYKGIKAATDLYVQNMKSSGASKMNHYNERIESQIIADKILDKKESDLSVFENVITKANEISHALSALNLRSWILSKENYSSMNIGFNYLLQVILLPFFLIGYLSNYLPFTLPIRLTKKVKDPLFLSSIRLAMGALMFSLYYIILLILLLVFIKPIWLAWALILIFPLCGIFSYYYYRWVVKTFAKTRNNRFKRQGNNVWIKMREEWLALSDILTRM